MLYSPAVTAAKKPDDKQKAATTGAGSAQQTAPQPGTAAPAPAHRRSGPLQKEVPPFEWKVVGYSQGVPLVLFKSVEQEEAEAQLQRHQQEAYYTKLALHPIKKKIPMPKNVVISPHDRPKPKERKPTKTKASAGKVSLKPTRVLIGMNKGAKKAAAAKEAAEAKMKANAKTKKKAAAKPKKTTKKAVKKSSTKKAKKKRGGKKKAKKK